MVMVIIELINHYKINFENPKDNIELKILDNLLFLKILNYFLIHLKLIIQKSN